MMARISGKALLLGAGIGTALVTREMLARANEAALDGQVALVTGGSRGLGYLLARELGRAGCRVAICARDAAELTRAAATLEGGGAEVLAVRCDVGDRAEVAQLVGEVERRFGRIDILVNNAGVIQVGPVETMTHADFAQAMDAMYWGVVNPTLAVLPAMRERRSGRIVTISSIGGKVAVPHLLPYTGAKFAAVGFSEGLRAELAGSGVSVTTVTPGLLRTGSYLNASFKGRRSREFTWFSIGDNLPLVSMDAERAARRIVRALKRGEAEVVTTVPATLLARLHGLAPGTTQQLLGLVNRWILPDADGAGTEAERGMVVQAESPNKVRDAITGWGRSAADRFHEYPGPVGVAASGNGQRG